MERLCGHKIALFDSSEINLAYTSPTRNKKKFKKWIFVDM